MTDQQLKGGIYICSNQYDRSIRFAELFAQYCDAGKQIGPGVCALDRNRQFIILGSDEFVDSILDVGAIDKQSSRSVTRAATPGILQRALKFYRHMKKHIQPFEEKHKKLKTDLIQLPRAISGNTPLTEADKVIQKEIDRINRELTESLSSDDFKALKKYLYSKEGILAETISVCPRGGLWDEDKLTYSTCPPGYTNIASDPPQTNDLLEYDLKNQLYIEFNKAVSDEKLKLDFPATEEEAMEEEKPEGEATLLPTLAGDRWTVNRNVSHKWKNRVPPFFPDLYKAVQGKAPLAFRLSDFLTMVAPSTLQLFAEKVVHAGAPINSLKHPLVSDKLFHRQNPLMPKGRIRPLVTYPEEELDGLPRFRPLYNTVLIVADADNMAASHPEAMRYITDLVRHEPTCGAHYFTTEFHSGDVAALTSMCDSLRKPVEKLKAQVTEVYDIASAAWAPVAIVRETKDQTTVRFKDVLLRADKSRTFAVVPSLIRRYSRAEALSSPKVLRAFLKEHDIHVEIYMKPPQLLALTDQDDTSVSPDKLPSASAKIDRAASPPPTPAPIGEEDKAAVECALHENRLDDLVHSDAVRLKLRQVKESLGKVYGKHLLVAGKGCLDTYARYLLKDNADLKAVDFKGTLDNSVGWKQLGLWQKSASATVPTLLVVVRTASELDRFLTSAGSRVLPRCRAYVMDRAVFERRGLPRTLGVRHVFLMGNDVRLAMVASDPTHGSGRFAVVTVWKYAVSAAPAQLARGNNAANKHAFEFGRDGSSSGGLGFSSPSSDKGLFPWIQSVNRYQLAKQDGVGAAARLSRTMLGLEFLEDVADEERRSFDKGLYELHAREGVTMEDILEKLRAPAVESFDGRGVLDQTRQWVDRIALKPGMRDMVLAAVQAILNGETYRAYAGATRTKRCVGLRKRMAVHAALLHKISAEAKELHALVKSLAKKSNARGALPKLLAVDANGRATDLVLLAVETKQGTTALLAHAKAKHAILDAYRRATLLALRNTWDELLQCPRLPGASSSTEPLVFSSLADHGSRNRIYADALQLAGAFQRARAPRTEGGRLGILLFNAMEGTPVGRLDGGAFGYLWEGTKNLGRKGINFARKVVDKAGLKTAAGAAGAVGTAIALGATAPVSAPAGAALALGSLVFGKKAVQKIDDITSTREMKSKYRQEERDARRAQLEAERQKYNDKLKELEEDLEYAFQNNDFIEANKIRRQITDLKKRYDPDIGATLSAEDAAAVKRVKSERMVQVPAVSNEELIMSDTVVEEEEDDDDELLGHGEGRLRHLRALRQLAGAEERNKQVDPPQFRMDPIAGTTKLQDILHHNMTVTESMEGDRKRAYLRHLMAQNLRKQINAKLKSNPAQLKQFLEDNKAAIAVAGGITALSLGPLALSMMGVFGTGYSALTGLASAYGAIGTAAGYGAAGVAGTGFLKSIYNWFNKNPHLDQAQQEQAMQFVQLLQNKKMNLDDFEQVAASSGLAPEIIQEIKAQANSSMLAGGALNAIGRYVLTGGAWVGVPLATAGQVVTVDPSTIRMPELVSLWESGMTLLPEKEEGEEKGNEVKVVFRKGDDALLDASSISGAFLRVFAEHASNCPATDDKQKDFIQEVIGLKTPLECHRSSSSTSSMVVVTVPSRPHDMLFLGRDGRSHTLLWNLAPRVRVECSQLVLG